MRNLAIRLAAPLFWILVEFYLIYTNAAVKGDPDVSDLHFGLLLYILLMPMMLVIHLFPVIGFFASIILQFEEDIVKRNARILKFYGWFIVVWLTLVVLTSPHVIFGLLEGIFRSLDWLIG